MRDRFRSFVGAVLAAVLPVGAAHAMLMSETLQIVPGESQLTLAAELFNTQDVSRVSGTIDVAYDLAGGGGATAGIAALAAVLIDPVTLAVELDPGTPGPELTVSAPAGEIEVDVLATGATANPAANAAGGLRFTQGGLDLTLAGLLTLADNATPPTTAPINLADAPAVAGQSINDAVLSFGAPATRLSAPIDITVSVPLGDIFLPVRVTGTLIAVSGGALGGDYNSDGFVSQGDLDLVLLNWGDTLAPAGFDENAIPGGGPFDGLMSQNELDGVLLNWGDGIPPVAAAIPEPGAGVVMVWLALVTLVKIKPSRISRN